MNSCPRYTIIKIKKILSRQFFKIFLIVYSRIRHALRSGVSLHRHQVKIKTAHDGRFKILIFLAEMKGLSDSHLRHVGAMGPFRYVRFKLRKMARFHQLTPRTQQSQIANALSTLQHQHKNKTPTMGRLIFVAEMKGFEPLIRLPVYHISNVAH